MQIKDIFDYNDRWDSVGLDCSNCKYEKDVEEWPDIYKRYSCGKHKVYLTAELNSAGYKNGEWFCKSFSDKGTANKDALSKFHVIEKDLEDNILYGFYGSNGYLKEVLLSDFEGVDKYNE